MTLEEARDLLPWYAAGALASHEAQAFEASLREFPQLQRELAEYRALQSVVATVGADEPAFRPELIDEAHRRIDALAPERHMSSESRVQPNFVAALIDRLLGGWDAMPMGARFAVAAQFAVIAVLAGFMVLERGESSFTTASGPSAMPHAGQRITVVFQPESSAEQIQTVLDAVDAQIVAGPSGQSAYVLDLGKADRAQTERAVQSLRENESVVRFAAPME